MPVLMESAEETGSFLPHLSSPSPSSSRYPYSPTSSSWTERKMAPFKSFSKRDALLVFIGAVVTHILSAVFGPQPPWASVSSTSSIIISSSSGADNLEHLGQSRPLSNLSAVGGVDPHNDTLAGDNFPETLVLTHAPGWTIFQDVYMANGTIFIVSDELQSTFPHPRYMTSTGLPGYATPENEAAREPTDHEMAFISTADAKRRWGALRDGEDGVRVVDGNTFLFNDPDQFLDHYYHFCAELLFGAWAFWVGTFPATRAFPPPSLGHHPPALTDAPSRLRHTPPPDRIIFPHTGPRGWHDAPGFNAYFLHAAFPGVAVEHAEAWEDRIATTVPPSSDIPEPDYPDVWQASQSPEAQAHRIKYDFGGLRGAEVFQEKNTVGRAWRFPRLLLADRSAAFRSELCGAQTQRTASEALARVRALGAVEQGRGVWWEQVRHAVVAFAGGSLAPADIASREGFDAQANGTIVITYVSRQGGGRRKLTDEDHERLVGALEELVNRRNEQAAGESGMTWELHVAQMEKMGKDEQVSLMANTTIMIGPHGNGLSHLILMPPSRFSAVIEIFYPNGFAHDYEWTSSVGMDMAYFAVWNDTVHPASETHDFIANYVEGFHGTQIPVNAETVTSTIEEHVDKVLAAS